MAFHSVTVMEKIVLDNCICFKPLQISSLCSYSHKANNYWHDIYTIQDSRGLISDLRNSCYRVLCVVNV